MKKKVETPMANNGMKSGTLRVMALSKGGSITPWKKGKTLSTRLASMKINCLIRRLPLVSGRRSGRDTLTTGRSTGKKRFLTDRIVWTTLIAC